MCIRGHRFSLFLRFVDWNLKLFQQFITICSIHNLVRQCLKSARTTCLFKIHVYSKFRFIPNAWTHFYSLFQTSILNTWNNFYCLRMDTLLNFYNTLNLNMEISVCNITLSIRNVIRCLFHDFCKIISSRLIVFVNSRWVTSTN